ncbi:MAG: AAA family ATPase [Muribaculaceae bacterium]|nr:AAA family ATPase [Muribaculaceae bacterium]
MKENIIGRSEEKRLLDKIYRSGKAEFVAVYGRRRVGKTFLVREFFESEMVFLTAGLAHENSARQIKSFYEDLVEYGLPRQEKVPADWIEVFSLLRTLIKSSTKQRKVIMLDELPWMDTPRSGFMAALEHFWNSWASARRDVVLIVCGSATSWIMDKLINNHGGLHNRLTHSIYLLPFTLAESELFLDSKGFRWSRYDIAVCYMIMGGIPYYLEMLDRQMNLSQNIDNLLFRPNGALVHEFGNLYAALFRNSSNYIKVVEALSSCRSGLTRNEIISHTGLKTGTGLTTILRNLETCGFIQTHQQYEGMKREGVVYQLIDFFTLFHFHFMGKKRDLSKWTSIQGKAEFHAWAGLTFELLALCHLREIKQKLGISSVDTRSYAWRCKGENGSQIDLVIDRADNTVNLCEMKFSINTFSIDRQYEMTLRNKLEQFAKRTNRRKSLQLTLVTTYGLADNKYRNIVDNEITLDDLFDKAKS